MKIKRILVIRFRRVGDSILSLVVCSSLRQSFPGAQIDYVLDENISSLYQGHPDIDNIISFSQEEKHSFRKYIPKVWRLMHHNKYDVIIDMRSTVQTLWFSLFSLKTPYRIGRKKYYNIFLHNYRVEIPNDKTLDMVSRNLMLLKPLEKEKAVQYVPDFKLYVTEKEKLEFRAYMEKMGINFSQPVIVAAVATRIPYKVWNKERIETVLGRIISKYNAQIVFNYGGEIERNYAVNMYNDMEQNKNIFINIHADNLRDLMALVSNCDFFFGNEGGPRHMAQSLSIPSFAIYPPSVEMGVWLPGNKKEYQGISVYDTIGADAIKDDMTFAEKFDFITVNEVWERVDGMLSKYLKR